MSIKDACVSVFNNWNNFSGRACRSEFWYFCLALFIAGFLISFIEAILYASIEGFPTIFSYGMEFKDNEWQSVRNPVGPLTLIFNAIIIIILYYCFYFSFKINVIFMLLIYMYISYKTH